MENNNKASSFNQTEYANKYNKAHYKDLGIKITEENRNIICDYCDAMKISRAKFLVAAARYCIDNTIDIDELLSHLK